MLVLPYPDRLGVDLDQFAQRIQQPPANAHRSPHSDILVREFLAGYFGCGIDRGAALVHHENQHLFAEVDAPDQLLGLAACRPIAHTDRFDIITVDQLPQCRNTCLCLVLRRMWINSTVMNEIPLRIQADYFTTRAKTRVQGQYPLGPQRRSQQQLPQVLRKNTDGFFIGLILTDEPELILDG